VSSRSNKRQRTRNGNVLTWQIRAFDNFQKQPSRACKWICFWIFHRSGLLSFKIYCGSKNSDCIVAWPPSPVFTLFHRLLPLLVFKGHYPFCGGYRFIWLFSSSAWLCSPFIIYLQNTRREKSMSTCMSGKYAFFRNVLRRERRSRRVDSWHMQVVLAKITVFNVLCTFKRNPNNLMN